MSTFVWYQYPRHAVPGFDTELRVGIAGDVWGLVFEMFWCQVAICALMQWAEQHGDWYHLDDAMGDGPTSCRLDVGVDGEGNCGECM